MPTHHKIIIGDSRKMSLVKDNSVQLIVTSPPYWQLKDYGTDTQSGFHDTYEDYINNLNLVWLECARVLSDGCRLCINIGDQFARAAYYGRYKVIPIRTEIIRFCETIGLDYMGAIIWQKNTTMNTTGGGAVMGSYPYPRNGILKIDYEFILIFKKTGNAPAVSPQQKAISALTNEEWNEYFSSHWTFPGVRQTDHIAMFPEELPKRLIRMFSFAGETVLDPFLGSGTTSLAAIHTGRNSIGYELNASFMPTIRKKLQICEASLFQQEEKFELLEDHTAICPDALQAALPYRFHDQFQLKTSTDNRKRNFGSRISFDEKPHREELFSVSKVISPSQILLNNGQLVKLIGIADNDTSKEQAICFLEKKLNNQRVYIKLEDDCPPNDSALRCYLYLKNRTFINIHLLRTGLVDIDETTPFKLLRKFKEVIKNDKQTFHGIWKKGKTA